MEKDSFEKKFRPLSVEESLTYGGMNLVKIVLKVKKVLKFIMEYSSDFISGYKLGKSSAV